jgi:hypothetical protein
MLSPESYKGANLSDGLAALVTKAGSVYRLEKYGGILICDEFEKLLINGKNDPLQNTVLLNFLGLLGGEKVLLEGYDYGASAASLDTKNIMVIICGAFSWLPPKHFSNLDKTLQCLKRLGIPSEVISRINFHIHLEQPADSLLRTVLQREADKISCGYGVPFDGKISELMSHVKKHHLGVRSIKPLVHQFMLNKSIANGVGCFID